MSLVFLSAASADEYTVGKNQLLRIPVTIPETKPGGGDFYVLKFEPVNVDIETEYVLLEEGIRIRFAESGIYNYKLVINHITKPSCAGVVVDEYAHSDIVVNVVD